MIKSANDVTVNNNMHGSESKAEDKELLLETEFTECYSDVVSSIFYRVSQKIHP